MTYFSCWCPQKGKVVENVSRADLSDSQMTKKLIRPDDVEACDTSEVWAWKP